MGVGRSFIFYTPQPSLNNSLPTPPKKWGGGGGIASRPEIVDRANQALPEVMLPDAVHDHARDQRARAVLEVRHPFRQRAPLLGGIGPAAFSARGCPVIRGRFASDKRSEKPQLHRLALRAGITAREQKGLSRLRAGVGERERGGRRVRFARFH